MALGIIVVALVAVVIGIYLRRKSKKTVVPPVASVPPTQAEMDKRQAAQDARELAKKV